MISYRWEPYGAGASITIGGLVAWMLVRRAIGPPIPAFVAVWLPTTLLGYAVGSATASILLRRGVSGPRLAPVVGAGILLCGVALSALRNNHGPPILIGAALSAILLATKAGRW